MLDLSHIYSQAWHQSSDTYLESFNRNRSRKDTDGGGGGSWPLPENMQTEQNLNLKFSYFFYAKQVSTEFYSMEKAKTHGCYSASNHWLDTRSASFNEVN